MYHLIHESYNYQLNLNIIIHLILIHNHLNILHIYLQLYDIHYNYQYQYQFYLYILNHLSTNLNYILYKLIDHLQNYRAYNFQFPLNLVNNINHYKLHNLIHILNNWIHLQLPYNCLSQTMHKSLRQVLLILLKVKFIN